MNNFRNRNWWPYLLAVAGDSMYSQSRLTRTLLGIETGPVYLVVLSQREGLGDITTVY